MNTCNSNILAADVADVASLQSSAVLMIKYGRPMSADHVIMAAGHVTAAACHVISHVVIPTDHVMHFKYLLNPFQMMPYYPSHC